jgi:toxin FitB
VSNVKIAYYRIESNKCIDSNLIIYSVQPNSVINKVEVSGYPKLNKEGIIAIENILQHLEMLLISHVAAEIAVKLRQQRKMSLGDAFIAATCLEHNLPLATRNIKDFNWIEDLTIYDPFIKNS